MPLTPNDIVADLTPFDLGFACGFTHLMQGQIAIVETLDRGRIHAFELAIVAQTDASATAARNDLITQIQEHHAKLRETLTSGYCFVTVRGVEVISGRVSDTISITILNDDPQGENASAKGEE